VDTEVPSLKILRENPCKVLALYRSEK